MTNEDRGALEEGMAQLQLAVLTLETDLTIARNESKIDLERTEHRLEQKVDALSERVDALGQALEAMVSRLDMLVERKLNNSEDKNR